ncbi:MAG TPA: nucleotide disphospho-sugar-binding domain-containing protein [Nocardioidaceae bacterium]|nr:nucleotide disphospho-sugar-binding domain-containing protein [Nocardioidaceae bacterium]
MSAELTVLFLPESAHGPTNQCIGLGHLLLKRGHRVVLAAEASWEGRLAPLGFDERLVDLAEPDPEAAGDDAGQFWIDFIANTAPEFRKSTIEQLETFIKPTYQALIDGAMYAERQLKELIDEVRPDVLVEDNVVLFPALTTSGAPFVRIVSCNPLEIPGDRIAPAFSGLAQDDPALWAPFRSEFERTHKSIWETFNAWVVDQGAAPLPYLEFMPRDNAANIYLYPREADYVAQRPLDDSWHRIDSSVRRTDEDYQIPEAIADGPEGSSLIYISLGTLGSADIDLMQRLVDSLAGSPHRFIVSKGPLAHRIKLTDNMAGEQALPQTTVIPQVDLVITHGGNNTTTEALHFGKPMVLLPLFWDQYDNAQRMDELGFGIRLATYEFTPEDLNAAVDRLLADTSLRRRLDGVGRRIRERDGLTEGADIIERIGLARRRKGSPGGRHWAPAQTGSADAERVDDTR